MYKKKELVAFGTFFAIGISLFMIFVVVPLVFGATWQKDEFDAYWNVTYNSVDATATVNNFVFPLNTTGNGTAENYVDTTTTGINASSDCSGMIITDTSNNTLEYYIVNSTDAIYGCDKVNTDIRVKHNISAGSTSNAAIVYGKNNTPTTDASSASSAVYNGSFKLALPIGVSDGVAIFDKTANAYVFNNTTASIPTFTAGGVIGRGLSFDGGNDVLTNATPVPNIGDLVNMTITLWFYANDTANEKFMFTTDDIEPGNETYCKMNPGGTITCFSRLATDVASLSSVSAAAKETWYHLAFTKDADTEAKLYLNGILEFTDSGITGNVPNPGSTMYIGEQGWSTHKWWNGMLDEFYWYDRVLTGSEINASYQIGNSSLPTTARAKFTTLGAETNSSQHNATQYSNEDKKPASGSAYNYSENYGFQIDWTADSGFFNTTNVTFEANFSGSTVTYTNSTTPALGNNSATTFYINFTQEQFDGANDFQYRWSATNGTTNTTSWYYYTIAKATPRLKTALWTPCLLTNSTTSAFGDCVYMEGYPLTPAGSVTDVVPEGADDGANLTLYRNTTIIHSKLTVLGSVQARSLGGQNMVWSYQNSSQLGVGAHLFNLTINETANWTANFTVYVFTLNKAYAIVNLSINGTQANSNGLNHTGFNLTAWSNFTDDLVYLETNSSGWALQSGAGSIENISVLTVENVVPNVTNITGYVASANFTNNIVSYNLTLDSVELANESYSDTVLQGESQTISITFSVPSGAEDLVTTLLWNGTVYANDSSTLNSTHLIVSRTFTTPNITQNTTNVTFFWNYTSDIFSNYTTTSHNQTVGKPLITACGGSLTNTTTLVLYVYNETTNNTGIFENITSTINMMFNFTVGGVRYVYNSTNLTSVHYVCMFPSYESYQVDSEITYEATDYPRRTYFLRNATLSNVSQDVNLYLLSSGEGSRITFTLRDSSGAVVSDAYISVARRYPELDAYKTVAVMKSDSAGKSNLDLEPYDVLYRFTVEKDYSVLHTFKDMTITLTSTELNIPAGDIVEYYQYQDISYYCAYTSSTRDLACNVIDTTGLTTEGCLKLWHKGALADTVICEDCATGTSASVNCTIPLTYNGTFLYQLMANITTNPVDFTILAKEFLSVEVSASIFGQFGLFIVVLLAGTAVFAGLIIHPILAILLLGTTLGFSMWFGIVNELWNALVAIVLIGMVIIYRLKSR